LWKFVDLFFFSARATPTPTHSSANNNNSALIGDIVGPVVGVLCLLALLIIVAIFLRRRKLEKGLEAFVLDDTESRSFDTRVNTLPLPGV